MVWWMEDWLTVDVKQKKKKKKFSGSEGFLWLRS